MVRLPGENPPVTGTLPPDRGSERKRVGCRGRLHSPHHRIKVGGEVEADRQMPGRRAHGTLEPLPPLVLTDLVGVLDGRGVPGVERKPTADVLEQQPDFLESVPVGLHRPGHLLPVASGRQTQEIPTQRVRPVQPRGPFRVARIPVDGDPHEVAGDRFGPDVSDPAALLRVVDPAVVTQFGEVLLNHQTAGADVPAG